ncbi:hypothetical protein pb186bvf_014193 [Paramecium bursaria]
MIGIIKYSQILLYQYQTPQPYQLSNNLIEGNISSTTRILKEVQSQSISPIRKINSIQ